MNDKKAKRLRKVAKKLAQGMDTRLLMRGEKVLLDGRIVTQYMNSAMSFRGIYRKLKRGKV